MKKISRRSFLAASAALAAASLTTGCGGASDGKTHLTFQIWDVAQRDGMQAMCDAYTEQHPDVVIEVQVTSWDEYWTKLEAATMAKQAPDIFWMHTNEILKYADNGKLPDCSAIVETEHFSDISLANASGSDGKLYAVPKDKDTVQAGGSILTEDKTRGNFDDPATRMGMEFYINLQKNDWCPTQTYFAETSPGTAFFSGYGSMFLEGNWNILSELQNYPEMVGKWDVAVLPKCPNPMNGDGRATISNGLSYATTTTNKHLDVVMDVLKFFGSEEGQRIQGESGAAIPAYEGLEDTWVGVFDEYPIDVTCFIDMFDYCIQSVNNAARPEWKTPVSDTLLKIYTGEYSIDEGLEQMQQIVDTASAEYYE